MAEQDKNNIPPKDEYLEIGDDPSGTIDLSHVLDEPNEEPIAQQDPKTQQTTVDASLFESELIGQSLVTRMVVKLSGGLLKSRKSTNFVMLMLVLLLGVVSIYFFNEAFGPPLVATEPPLPPVR